MNAQIETGDLRVGTIFLQVGYLGFLVIKITVVHQMCMSPATTAV